MKPFQGTPVKCPECQKDRVGEDWGAVRVPINSAPTICCNNCKIILQFVQDKWIDIHEIVKASHSESNKMISMSNEAK